MFSVDKNVYPYTNAKGLFGAAVNAVIQIIGLPLRIILSLSPVNYKVKLWEPNIPFVLLKATTFGFVDR